MTDSNATPLKSLSASLIVLFSCCSLGSVAVHPLIRSDVMGRYLFVNEKQCQRMCWYRRLCSSSSWNSQFQDPNCVLHTDSVPGSTIIGPSPSPEEQWTETPASDSTIHNACRPRHCDDLSVCVPHPPLTSHSPSSFHCLPMPAQCGSPPAVPNGTVNVSGTQQGDTAHLTCDPAFVISPKGASLDSMCQGTSTWASFNGTCLQYEFHPQWSQDFKQSLPWSLEEDSEICVKGVFTEEGQMVFNFQPDFSGDNIDLHFMFRDNFRGWTGVYWTTKVDNMWDSHRKVGEMPLTPGDSFIVSFHLLPDHLHVTLNTSHVYGVPLSSQGGDGVDLSQSKVLIIEGKVDVSYVNLVSGC